MKCGAAVVALNRVFIFLLKAISPRKLHTNLVYLSSHSHTAIPKCEAMFVMYQLDNQLHQERRRYVKDPLVGIEGFISQRLLKIV